MKFQIARNSEVIDFRGVKTFLAVLLATGLLSPCVNAQQSEAAKGAYRPKAARKTLEAPRSSYEFISGLTDFDKAYAADFVCDYLKEKKFYGFSSDSLFVNNNGIAVEYAKLSVIVTTTLTEADRLNGDEWRGRVTLNAEAVRYGRMPSYSGFDAFNKSPSWGKWQPMANSIVTVRVYKKSGRFFIAD